MRALRVAQLAPNADHRLCLNQFGSVVLLLSRFVNPLLLLRVSDQL